MAFKKDQQWIGGFQSTNSGRDIGSQLQVQTLQDFLDGLNLAGNNSNYIASGSPTPPLLANNRHLFNESYLASVNTLHRFKKEWQLKMNVSYLNDERVFDNSTIYTYQIQNGVIDVTQKIRNQVRRKPFLMDFTLMNNTPKNYTKNKLAIELTTEEGHGIIEYNNVNINQEVPKNLHSFSNNFSSIFSIGKQLISLASNVSYRKRMEELEIFPGIFNTLLSGADSAGSVKQSITQEGFSMNNYFQWSGTKKFELSIKARIQIFYKRYIHPY